MYKFQILAFLVASLSFCAVAQEGTLSPTETETLDVTITGKTFTQSTELHTQAPATDVNITESYDIFTENSTMETNTTLNPAENYNSTNIDITEDNQEGLTLGTLIGIIAGVVVTIGFSAIIILLIVRKMGRYSP